MDQYLSKGFISTTEVNGTVSDPNCVYIGHSAISGIQTMEMTLHALLRKLFWKCAKWDCTNIGTVIPGYDDGTSTGWKLMLYRVSQVTGVTSSWTYETGAADTIMYIVGDRANGTNGTWPAFYNVINDYAVGTNSVGTLNVDQPDRLALYKRDGNVTNFYHFMGDINLKNEVVHMKTSSTLKVQNRTKSASGDSSTDNVASNPIYGKLYEFSSGAPRAKVEGAFPISAVSDLTAVITARADQFSGAGSEIFREPPSPKIFWNCSKSKGQTIQPGDIKSTHLSFTKAQPFLKFVKNLNLGRSDIAAGQKQINLVGKSQLLALEDMININSTENISIAYEVNRTFACYLTTSNARAAQGHLYQLTESNNP